MFAVPGVSAIHLAAIGGDTRTISALLTAGVSPDLRSANESALTPLFVASFYGRVDAMKTLLQAGADRTLVAGGRWKGGGASLAAAMNDQPASLKYLAGLGEDLGVWRDSEGFALLHVAANNGSLGAIEELLDMGMPVDVRDNRKLTPLAWAAAGANGRAKATVDLLVKSGAEPDLVLIEGATAMHMAAAHGSKAGMEALVAHGLSLTSPDASGRLPVHFAAQGGHAAALGWLAEQGVDFSVEVLGETPLSLAKAGSHSKAVRAIKRALAKASK